MRAQIVPKDVLTGGSIGRPERAEGTDNGEREPIPCGRPLDGLGKTEQDGIEYIMGHETEHYSTPLGPEVFFYINGGWGCLLRYLTMVPLTLLGRPKGTRGLISLVCKGDMMDYIILVGEALEKMGK